MFGKVKIQLVKGLAMNKLSSLANKSKNFIQTAILAEENQGSD